jgi:ribosomal protein L40E
MPNLPRSQPKAVLVIAFFVLVGIYSVASVAMAQITPSSTVTQVSSISSTSTLLTTITSPAFNYTTTTRSLNSTVGVTEITVQALTTVTSTYTTIVNGIVIATISSVSTQVSTQTTQLLGTIWGESLTIILIVGAVMSFVVSKLRSRLPRGIICGKCGNRNPPFARAFCVKCGHTLKEE